MRTRLFCNHIIQSCQRVVGSGAGRELWDVVDMRLIRVINRKFVYYKSLNARMESIFC